MNYPYSDTEMRYLASAHRYVLTEEGVRTALGLDLLTRLNKRGVTDTAALVGQVLNQISMVVYHRIYSNAPNHYLAEYLAAKHPMARNILLEAMQQQLMYFLVNGDLTKISGVDTRRGSTLDRDSLQHAAIDPMTAEILDRELDSAGLRLTYCGFQWSAIPLPAYESEGY